MTSSISRKNRGDMKDYFLCDVIILNDYEFADRSLADNKSKQLEIFIKINSCITQSRHRSQEDL